MSDLTPERAEAIVFEIDYWRALLGDLTRLSECIEGASGDVANGIVALLSLLQMTADPAQEFVRDGLDAANAALRQLLAMQQTLMRIIELADGRSKALAQELPR